MTDRRPARPKDARSGKGGGHPARALDRETHRAPRGPASLGGGVRLVYEDDEVIVVDKPPGLVTAILPGEPDAAADKPSVFGELKRYARGRRKGPVRVWVIHRLDKEASGLLVFAKTERAFAWLKEDFRARRAHRLYLAVVENEFAPEALSGTLQGFMAEDDRGLMRGVPGRSTIAGNDDRGPQLAVTHYRVIAQGQGMALVQVRLRTGRKNQIRVQMSEAGHPLVGDYRYRPPGTPKDPIKRMCLHATELGFSHPSRGETLRFSSPAPRAFWTLVGAQPPVQGTPADLPGIGAGQHAGEPDGEPYGGRSSGVSGPPRPSEIEPAPGSTAAASPAGPRFAAGAGPSVSTSWDHVATWYEDLLDRGRSDHQRDVIIPGALRLLRPARGGRVLDVACGEGTLCRRLAAIGVEAVGVDASEKLVNAARAAGLAPGSAPVRFEVGDARSIGQDLGTFDAAACVMALMNIDPIEPVLRGVARVLRPGGAFVAVLLHPAFRAPGQTSWGWDEARGETGRESDRGRDRRGAKFDPRERRPGKPPAPQRGPTTGQGRSGVRQYRRVDGYLSHGQTPIVMNPGHAAHGKEPVTTWTFHRPIQAYAKALAESGFMIEALEEWPSLRRSAPGPRASEENRARHEIPMFLGIRAVLVPARTA